MVIISDCLSEDGGSIPPRIAKVLRFSVTATHPPKGLLNGSTPWRKFIFGDWNLTVDSFLALREGGSWSKLSG